MKNGTRRRVLVLDRDDGVRAEIGRLFEEEFDVASFGSTGEAVAALRSDCEYVLAVCEFEPSDPGAAALLRLISERETAGRLRCAMTLTGALREEMGECASVVLAKPFSRKALLEALALQPVSGAAASRR